MSSISSVSSGVSPFSSGVANVFSSLKKDLGTLQSSLQSGNLSAAQSAFASVQKDFQSLPTPPAGANGATASTGAPIAIQNDLKSVQSALQSGDVKGAQSAFAKLQTDLKSVRVHQGHHGGGKPPIADDGDSDDSSQAAGSVATQTRLTSATSLVDTLLSAVQTVTGSSSSQSVGSSVNQLG